ncbi:CCE_0567 family metalloprotein [Oceanospirillum sediminis]|uniref:Rop family plasmid primer RNA-binding protein n=1 Tax=Oceanospirillum sediminis TaxID=2760088 RepID=A0A839IPT6_9GAMM|nr:CCE_0567 family metalloprotein [Oceanospirillum sediminis]MBB1486467.1 hypothetical protein [Oceanospirillum sediminis]
MSPEEIKALEKEVRKAKRIASEAAMALHDLVEDSLPAGYEQLPQMSDATYQACLRWDQVRTELAAVKEGV